MILRFTRKVFIFSQSFSKEKKVTRGKKREENQMTDVFTRAVGEAKTAINT